MTKKKKLLLFSVLILSFFLITGGFLYNKTNKPKSISLKKTTVKEQKKESKESKKYISKIQSYQNEYNNSDIVGELKIKEIDFDEIVAKGNDNNYYLTHDLYKNESKFGAAYVDYRLNDLDNAKQINIYGHNSDYYDLPFKKLEKYLDESTFTKSNSIVFDTDNNEFEYKIISVKIITAKDDEHMIVNFSSNTTWLNHVSKIRENTLYDSNEEFTATDDLLIIQTCLYNPNNSYLLIISKKLK